MLNLEAKKPIVAELSEVVGTATSIIAADYRGLTVSVMNALRKNARKTGVSVGVFILALWQIRKWMICRHDKQFLPAPC